MTWHSAHRASQSTHYPTQRPRPALQCRFSGRSARRLTVASPRSTPRAADPRCSSPPGSRFLDNQPTPHHHHTIGGEHHAVTQASTRHRGRHRQRTDLPRPRDRPQAQVLTTKTTHQRAPRSRTWGHAACSPPMAPPSASTSRCSNTGTAKGSLPRSRPPASSPIRLAAAGRRLPDSQQGLSRTRSCRSSPVRRPRPRLWVTRPIRSTEGRQGPAPTASIEASASTRPNSGNG